MKAISAWSSKGWFPELRPMKNAIRNKNYPASSSRNEFSKILGRRWRVTWVWNGFEWFQNRATTDAKTAMLFMRSWNAAGRPSMNYISKLARRSDDMASPRVARARWHQSDSAVHTDKIDLDFLQLSADAVVFARSLRANNSLCEIYRMCSLMAA